MPARRGKGEFAPAAGRPQVSPRQPSRLGLLLLDIVDHLSHVVLVLAEFGGVLDQLLLLFLGLFDRDALFLLFLDRLGLLGLQIGIDVPGADRLQLFLDRRDRARAARLQKRLGIEGRAAFRADDRVARKIVIARAAARADALGAPFGFCHAGSLSNSSLFYEVAG